MPTSRLAVLAAAGNGGDKASVEVAGAVYGQSIWRTIVRLVPPPPYLYYKSRLLPLAGRCYPYIVYFRSSDRFLVQFGERSERDRLQAVRLSRKPEKELGFGWYRMGIVNVSGSVFVRPSALIVNDLAVALRRSAAKESSTRS